MRYEDIERQYRSDRESLLKKIKDAQDLLKLDVNSESFDLYNIRNNRRKILKPLADGLNRGDSDAKETAQKINDAADTLINFYKYMKNNNINEIIFDHYNSFEDYDTYDDYRNNDNFQTEEEKLKEFMKDGLDDEFFIEDGDIKVPKPKYDPNMNDQQLNKFLEDYYDKAFKYYQYMKNKRDSLNNELSDSLSLPGRTQMELPEHIEKDLPPEKNQDNPRLPGRTPLGLPEHIEKEKQQEKKRYNMDAILYRLGKDSRHTKIEDFVYKHKDIKYWNWHKTKSRTIGDKPMKLVQAVFYSVYARPVKWISNKIYDNCEDLRKRIDESVKAVDELTAGEIKFLMDNLKARGEVQYLNVLPDVVRERLQQKLQEELVIQVSDVNIKITELYDKIVNDYNYGLQLRMSLNNSSIDPAKKFEIEKEIKKNSENLMGYIIELEDCRSLVDGLMNASGLYGMSENRKHAILNRTGGRNATRKDFNKERGAAGRVGFGFEDAMNAGDGFKAAERFIYLEQLHIDGTKIKRTAKNWFGKTNTGAYEYSPLVEQMDYTNDTYIRDVFATIGIIIQTMNLVKQIQNAAKIDQFNKEMASNQQNYQQFQADMSKYQSQVQHDYNNMLKFKNVIQSGTNQAIDEANKMAEQMLREYPGMNQGVMEYSAMQGQAQLNGTSFLQSDGSLYREIDSTLHTGSYDPNNFISSCNGLSPADKLKAYCSELTRLHNQTLTNLNSVYQNSNGQTLLELNQFYNSTYAGSFDTTNFTNYLNNLSSYNLIGYQQTLADIKSFVDSYVINQPAIAPQLNLALHQLEIKSGIPEAVATLADLGVLSALGKKTSELVKEQSTEQKDQISEKVKSVKIDDYEEAKRRFDNAMEEWKKQSAFTRLKERIFKEKPNINDFVIEVEEERRKHV